MTILIKPLANSVALTNGGTPNTIFLAKCVYLSANGSQTDITVKYANGDTKASFSIPMHTQLVIEKDSTETLETSHAINATKIAFRG